MSSLVESIPANWYFDPEIYALEQEKIFRKNWIFVTHADALGIPGEFVTETIAGQSVVLVRAGENGSGSEPDNGINGFLNLCRHRASPVCAAHQGELQRFTCPYHGWSYDLDGKLLHAPGFEDELDKQRFGLIPVRVEVWNNLVFACLDPDVVTLEQWLGDIVKIAADYPSVASMEFDSVRTSDCGANWKNYSDNSAEGYHLGSIHPGLNRSLIKSQTCIQPYENGNFIGFNVTYKSESELGSPGFWIYKFPGLLIHFSLSGFNIERIIPVDENSARMQRWFWFKSDIDASSRNETIAFSNQVMDEDMGICRLVQKNLQGGIYDTGVLSPEREPGTIFFQQCVRNALAGE